MPLNTFGPVIMDCCCWPTVPTLDATLVIGLPIFGSGLAIEGTGSETGEGGTPWLEP